VFHFVAHLTALARSHFNGAVSPVATRRLLALFAFPHTVTHQGTIESRSVTLPGR